MNLPSVTQKWLQFSLSCALLTGVPAQFSEHRQCSCVSQFKPPANEGPAWADQTLGSAGERLEPSCVHIVIRQLRVKRVTYMVKLIAFFSLEAEPLALV